GDIGVRVQGVEGALLPGDAEGSGDALLLRGAVPLGGDQLHVPAPALGEDPRDVEGADAGGVRVRAEGTPADHAHAPPPRRRRVRFVLPRSGSPARRAPGADPVPVPAVAEVRSRADRSLRRVPPTD